MSPDSSPKAERRETHHRWKLADHVPAPVEHRGPDRTRYTEDHGIRYLYVDGEPDTVLVYDGPISEVVL